MIGSDHEALIDRHGASRPRARVGGPLVMIGALMALWVSGRAILWESPFPVAEGMAEATRLLAEAPGPGAVRVPGGVATGDPVAALRLGRNPASSLVSADQGPAPRLGGGEVRVASGHHYLWSAALSNDGRDGSWGVRRIGSEAASARQASVPVFPGAPPFIARQRQGPEPATPDRWSLGAWAFAREGSRGQAIGPGPAPVYGASQAGANLSYRIAPGRASDPRAYLRASQALIDGGETEAALGLSARPIRGVPLRGAAELRLSESRFGRDARPAAFAITEIPPLALPLDSSAEFYAAGGYVGGDADTAFAEGQATITRSLASFDLQSARDLRVSVGAGAWGGAQRGAQRMDIGPTLRVDLALGAIPARVSIDYRERVGGDAAPNSGVAATLSTQF